MRIPGTLTLPSASGSEREAAAPLRPSDERGGGREERPREPLLPTSDSGLLSAAALLTGIGIVMVYSLTAPLSPESAVPAFFVRHLEGVAAGIVCAVLAFRLPLAAWRRVALPGWVISVLLLVLTHAIGVRTNGSRSWRRCCLSRSFSRATKAPRRSACAGSSHPSPWRSCLRPCWCCSPTWAVPSCCSP